jgi:hypothetical protein
MSMKSVFTVTILVLVLPIPLLLRAEPPALDEATTLRLRYRLLEAWGGTLPCDVEPASAPADETRKALKEFPTIKKEGDTFEGIAGHLGLQGHAEFSDDEKVLVYREYEKLGMIRLEPSGNRFAAAFGPGCKQLGEPSTAFFIDRQGQVMTATKAVNEGGPRADSGKSPASPGKLSVPELRYRLLQEFGDVWSCGSPVARIDEAERAFPNIQQDTETVRVMVTHLGLAGVTDFSRDQKTLLYREYARLRAIDLAPLAEKYRFAMSVPASGNLGSSSGERGGRGLRIEGIISPQGEISVLKKDSVILSCPICLAATARIDTPLGPVAVRDLREGMLVWTLNVHNERVAAPIRRIASASVPAKHLMMHFVFTDGRELWASPGHPTVDGRTLGELRESDLYDRAAVKSADAVSYEDTSTFDLLPAGDTGFYWANDVLLASTLK